MYPIHFFIDLFQSLPTTLIPNKDKQNYIYVHNKNFLFKPHFGGLLLTMLRHFPETLLRLLTDSTTVSSGLLASCSCVESADDMFLFTVEPQRETIHRISSAASGDPYFLLIFTIAKHLPYRGNLLLYWHD